MREQNLNAIKINIHMKFNYIPKHNTQLIDETIASSSAWTVF